MSDKKSTRKKPKKERLTQTQINNHLQTRLTYLSDKIMRLDSAIESLRREQEGARDLIWRQLDTIIDTLSYNKIFPEPENRWVPSVNVENLSHKKRRTSKHLINT